MVSLRVSQGDSERQPRMTSQTFIPASPRRLQTGILEIFSIVQTVSLVRHELVTSLES